MSLLAPVSVGEFLDKLTILEIKSEKITDPQKLDNILQELTVVRTTWQSSAFAAMEMEPELSQLKAVNERLWAIEDDIRDKERDQLFDAKFIELARSVYITNDQRAALKKALSLKSGSELVEEKSYAEY
ncbi:MAG: hypothetical protein WBN90_12285 [Gammaproteobacteria bacterium]